MRTYEVAAMGGCMLVEDTPDHRDLFGQDEEAVVYFRTSTEAVERLRALLADAPRRAALALRVRERIVRGEHTYAARLRQMLAPLSEAEVA
jgi:spore maturation protein CgeB